MEHRNGLQLSASVQEFNDVWLDLIKRKLPRTKSCIKAELLGNCRTRHRPSVQCFNEVMLNLLQQKSLM